MERKLDDYQLLLLLQIEGYEDPVWEYRRDEYYFTLNNLARRCTSEYVSSFLTIENKRISLFLARELARNNLIKADSLASIIGSISELKLFMEFYCDEGIKTTLSNQVKKAIAICLNKLNPDELLNDRRFARKLLKLVHPKPVSEERDLLFSKVIKGD